MNLYIRDRGRRVVFLHDINELRNFIEVYVGQEVVIGDLSTFNRPMVQCLLKFVEENPRVDCYSSYDIDDPILMSRFTKVFKEPLDGKASELGDNVSYYSVHHGTSMPSGMKMSYVDCPELRNFIKACLQG